MTTEKVLLKRLQMTVDTGHVLTPDLGERVVMQTVLAKRIADIEGGGHPPKRVRKAYERLVTPRSPQYYPVSPRYRKSNLSTEEHHDAMLGPWEANANDFFKEVFEDQEI